MDTVVLTTTLSRLWWARRRGLAAVTRALIVLFTGTGCAANKIAVTKLGNAIASGGTTYASDNDSELVRSAALFSLKLMENLP
jgi:hypothetical protein